MRLARYQIEALKKGDVSTFAEPHEIAAERFYIRHPNCLHTDGTLLPAFSERYNEFRAGFELGMKFTKF